MNMYGDTTSLWGHLVLVEFSWLGNPQEDVGFPVAEEELDPRLPKNNKQDQGFEFPPIGLLHEVQNDDKTGSDYIPGHIGHLLLPYYSNYQRMKPLSDTA